MVKKIFGINSSVTDTSMNGGKGGLLATFALSDKACYEDRGIYLLKDRYDRADIDFIVALPGEGRERSMIAGFLALQVKQVLRGNEPRTPVNDLLSNLLLDNILHTNIESEAYYLGLDPSEVRRIFIARAETGRESALLTKAQNTFTGNADVYVVSVERGKTALIVGGLPDDKAELKAKEIFDGLGGSKNGVVRIGYGLSVDNLEDLINSYRQANTALEVASLFKPDEIIVSYEKLGAVLHVLDTFNIEPNDKVKAFVNVNNLSDEEYLKNHFIVMCTKKGVVKKTSLEAYSRPRTNGIIAVGIREGDELVTACLTDGNSELLIASKNGKVVRCTEEEFREMGRGASGVKGITLDGEEDAVISMICTNNENEDILVVSENGFGKKSQLKYDPDKNQGYRPTHRGGKGVTTMKVTDKTGGIVALTNVSNEEDLMIINRSGITIRMKVSELRVLGRNTQGVKLINLRGKDYIASITKVPTDNEEETTPVEGTEQIENQAENPAEQSNTDQE